MFTRIVSNRLSLLIVPLVVTSLAACHGASLGTANSNGNTNANHADGTVDTDASLCGVGDDEKVVAGTDRIWNGTLLPEQCLSTGQQRAVVALLTEDWNHRWSNVCTGTMINDTAVLTAAHCVQRYNGTLMQPADIRVAVGADAASPDHTFLVSEVYANPGYSGGGDASHDLGLLILAEPITNASVRVLPIPVNGDDLPQSLLGQTVQNAGFGETDASQDNHLLYWTVEEISQIDPAWFQVWGGGAPNGSSVCFGDSGGPSFHLFNGNSLSLLGTVSWGDPSCMDHDYFARTDDSFFWIEQYTGTLDPCVGLDTAGTCDGDVALWCENGSLRQQCCGAQSTTCAPDAQGNHRCAGDECGGLSFQGECQGDDAVWCENGQLKRRRCAPCDQVCGWIDDVMGNYCIDP